jgi:hypothetical protein
VLKCFTTVDSRFIFIVNCGNNISAQRRVFDVEEFDPVFFAAVDLLRMGFTGSWRRAVL